MATENLIMEMVKQEADRQVSMSRTFLSGHCHLLVTAN